MSVAATYEIRILSPAGVLLSTLAQQNGSGPNGWNSLSITKGLSAVGSLTLTLPTGLIEPYIMQDTRIEVWRSVNGGPLGLLLNQTWFCRKPSIRFAQNAYTTTITALSALALLESRHIAYNDGTSQANKSGAADNLINAYCRENIGASGGAGRDLSGWLQLQGDQSLGASVTKNAARRPLLQTCQELAQASTQAGTRLYVDIVGCASTGGLTMRTWASLYGLDRRVGSLNPLILSPQAGNLDDAEWTRDYTQQSTFIYAGAAGQGSDRIIGTASDTGAINASPFGRKERFVNANQASTQAAADDEAKAALRSYRVKDIITGTIVQNETTIFGVHWGLGDLVTAQFLTATGDDLVEAASIKVDSNGQETVTGQLRSI